MNTISLTVIVISIFFITLSLAITAIMTISWWKIFKREGHPGWGALIPFYNIYLKAQVAGFGTFMTVLCFVPVLSIIPNIIMPFTIAQNQGRSGGFGAGLLLLPILFYPILAFNNKIGLV